MRHGESTWNAERRLQGQRDDAGLTERGRAEAAAAAEALRSEPIVAVYSSDLRRALETAWPIAAGHGLVPRPTIALREQGYGVLEGLPTSAALRDPGYDLLDPDDRACGGESIRDVYERVGAGLTEIVETHDGSAVVLVSHGDTLRIALARLAGFGADAVPWREIPNGSVTTVEASVEFRAPAGRERA